MRQQHIIYQFCCIGAIIILIFLPTFRFDLAIATTDTNNDENLIARRRNRLRLTGAKPGGDTNTVKGSILIPETSTNISQEDSSAPDPLIARFTEELYFQIQLDSDPKEIERIEISIFKNNQDTGETEIYNHTEKFSPYCFFEGDSPCGSIDEFWRDGSKPDGPLTNQRVENGQYSAYINIYRKNIANPVQWFFRFEIQRPS